MSDMTSSEIAMYNHEKYHQNYHNWGWIDDTYRELGYGTLKNEGILLSLYDMDDEESIESQLIAEELGLV